MKDRILCIGEALIDFIPDDSNISLKEVSGFKKMLGGAPANVACAIAKLGGNAKLITKVGNDAFGEYIIDELDNYGVDTSAIIKSDEYDTSLAFVTLDENGNRDFKFYRKTAADLNLDLEDICETVVDDIAILHFGSVNLASKKCRLVHDYLIKLAKQNGSLISFDPNLRLELWEDQNECKEIIKEYLASVDILKVSNDELSFITDIEDVDEAMVYLFSLGIKEVVYTMGALGARIYFNDMTYIESKGIKVNVVDTTGAGDAFIGTYLYFMANSENEMLEGKVKSYMALLLANKCAAYSCTKYGAACSYLSHEDIK